MRVRHYRELITWQRGVDFVEGIYLLSQRFPREELYGPTSQLRRAAVSIAANIAEGQGRGVGAEFAHHLRIANGSRQEAEMQILIAVCLRSITEQDAAPAFALSEELGRLLAGLNRSIRCRQPRKASDGLPSGDD